MLFNEPKLLKCNKHSRLLTRTRRFSALQRAEIAEMLTGRVHPNLKIAGFSALQRAEIAEIGVAQQIRCAVQTGFSALQRAEIAEIVADLLASAANASSFSALQRAEIAEIVTAVTDQRLNNSVSVLFNEPKLLKFGRTAGERRRICGEFQCSSTSRNC